MKYGPYPSEICLFHICSLFIEEMNNYYKITVHTKSFVEKGLIQKDIFSFDIQRKTGWWNRYIRVMYFLIMNKNRTFCICYSSEWFGSVMLNFTTICKLY